MDINATLFGQFITFSILVWVTMKYIWPPITKTIRDREKKIAAGLEAAERGKQALATAEHKASSIIREAKQQASQILEQANLHSAKLVEEAKNQARDESQKIIDLAQGEIDREVTKAKETLKKQVATLAVAGAEKIIQRNLNDAVHQDLLDQLAAEI